MGDMHSMTCRFVGMITVVMTYPLSEAHEENGEALMR